MCLRHRQCPYSRIHAPRVADGEGIFRQPFCYFRSEPRLGVFRVRASKRANWRMDELAAMQGVIRVGTVAAGHEVSGTRARGIEAKDLVTCGRAFAIDTRPRHLRLYGAAH
jgi:hypothetical protein